MSLKNGNMKQYTVYLKKDDTIVASGTARECQRQMGFKSLGVFYSVISRVYRGISTKYDVYSFDENEPLDDDD